MTRFVTVFASVLGVGIGVASIATAEAPKKIEERFYQSWLEVERIDAGVSTKDPDRLIGYTFTRKDTSSWPRRGELSKSHSEVARLDTSTSPMRVDFVDRTLVKLGSKEMKTIVLPCIFEFDAGKLRIASTGRWYDEREFDKGQDYETRPKDFKSTKENGVRVRIMEVGVDLAQD